MTARAAFSIALSAALASSVAAQTVRLTAVGDIRLDGPVGELIASKGPKAPTAPVRELLEGDIVLGNLECPVTDRGTRFPKKWNFRAPPKNLAALKDAGFTVVNLANNHVFDYSLDGFVDTMANLKKAGIPYVGAGRSLSEAAEPHIREINGVRVGIIGYTSTFPNEAWAKSNRAGVLYSDHKKLPDVVKRAKKRADVVVITFHGGTELDPYPNEIQQAFGRAAIDAGADLVIGHHPHIVQPVEVYRGKFILHSIGNFMFVSPTPITRLSVIVQAELSKSGVERLRFFPIDTWSGPVKPASLTDADSIRQALNVYGALDLFPERIAVETPGQT